MANKKKTTKKSTSTKAANKNVTKKTSVKAEKELKKKEIEKELDEEELDEAYEDEYELDEDEFEDEEDFEEDEDDFEEDEEDLEEEYEEEEDEFEDEEDFEEKPSKKESSETTGSKKLLWIVLGCVLAFLVLSFVLPSPTVKEKNENETVVENSNPSVSEWLSESKKEKVVTIIASSTCPHCKEYRPVIEKLAKDNNFKLYFFEADLLNETDQVSLVGSYELPDYEGAVPYTFIVDSGKVVASTVGFATEDETVEFLKKNKIMK